MSVPECRGSGLITVSPNAGYLRTARYGSRDQGDGGFGVGRDWRQSSWDRLTESAD
jgi:hypothetical protein